METLFGADLAIYAFAFLCVIFGSAVQGSTGLGFGMVAAPVLAIVDPVLVPGPLLVLALLISILLAAREWKAIDKRGLGLALAGRIPASVLAGLTMAVLPAQAFGLVFASLVLTAIGFSLSGWRVSTSPRAMVVAGAASGYMGTITSIGAPPMAIVYQNSAGPLVRSTMGAFFVIGAAISILVLAVFGKFGWRELQLSVGLAPAVLVGFAISFWGRGVVDRGRVRVALLALSGASAAILLIDSLIAAS